MQRPPLLLTLILLLTACGQDGTCPEDNLGCTDSGGKRVGGSDSRAQDAIGQWELSYVVVARDAVNRPVDVAEIRWNLEVFKASRNEFTGLYDVSAVLNGGTLCAVTTNDFDSGVPGCTQIGLTLPGRCANHGCTRYIDQVFTGRYDADKMTFEFGRQTLEAFVAEQESGYVEVYANLAHDGLPTDGTEVEDCGEDCVVTIVPDGLFAATWPTFQAETRRSRLRRLSPDARATAPPPESELEIAVGDQAAVSDLLLGDYNLSAIFYEDEGQVRTQVGQLDYAFEVFEVRPIGAVGEYQWFGALRADGFCWAVDTGGQCESFGPVSLGRCASTCVTENEYAVTGFYDAFTGGFRLNRLSAGMYAGGDLEYVAVSFSLHIEDESEFDHDGLAWRECTDTCNWSLTTRGTITEGFVDMASGDSLAVVAEKIP